MYSKKITQKTLLFATDGSFFSVKSILYNNIIVDQLSLQDHFYNPIHYVGAEVFGVYVGEIGNILKGNIIKPDLNQVVQLSLTDAYVVIDPDQYELNDIIELKSLPNKQDLYTTDEYNDAIAKCQFRMKFIAPYTTKQVRDKIIDDILAS